MSSENHRKSTEKSPSSSGLIPRWPVDPAMLAEAAAGRTDSLLLLFDEQNRLLMCNESVSEFIENPRSLLGKNLEEYLPPDVVREIERLFEEARAADGVVEVERSFSHRGRPVWLLSRIVAIPSPDGKGKWIIGYSRDVTERKWERTSLQEARKKLEFISEYTSDSILMLNPEGHIVWANKATERISGYSLDEILNGKMRCEDVVHPEDLAVVRTSFEEMKSKPESHAVEFRLRRKDGKWIHIEQISRPVTDRDGKLRGVVATARDITGLRESEEIYRFLAENALDIISLHDLDGNFQYASPSSKHLLGFHPRELVGTSIYRFLSREDGQIFRSSIEALKKGTIQNAALQSRLRHKSGQWRWFDTRLKLVVGAGGRPERLLCTFRDISDNKKVQDALVRSHKLMALGTLAGGIAHEFNNLHAIILSNASFILKEGHLDDQSREDVEGILDAAKRANSITKQLITYSGGQLGRTESVSLNDVVKSTLPIVRNEFASEGIKIEENLEPHLPNSRINRGLIQQVLMHLLTNARHAVMESESKIIKVKTGSEGDRVFLQVEDTGRGIPSENIDRVFDPFYTTKGPLGGSTIPGTGLGLSVSQAIVLQHDGEMRAESSLGAGSAFTVWLPVEEERPAPSPPPDEISKARSAKILVVDDEVTICSVIKRLLGTLGHKVDIQTKGREAISMLEKRDYDLVLVDLQMPDMPGEKIIEYIARLPDERRPAFIVLTGKIDVDSDALIARGAVDILEKPFQLELLAERVSDALIQRKQGA